MIYSTDVLRLGGGLSDHQPSKPPSKPKLCINTMNSYISWTVGTDFIRGGSSQKTPLFLNQPNLVDLISLLRWDPSPPSIVLTVQKIEDLRMNANKNALDGG